MGMKLVYFLEFRYIEESGRDGRGLMGKGF